MSRKGNEVFEGGGPNPAIPRRDVLKDDFGFEIPTQTVPLPSGGTIYPVDSSMHGEMHGEMQGEMQDEMQGEMQGENEEQLKPGAPFPRARSL